MDNQNEQNSEKKGNAPWKFNGAIAIIFILIALGCSAIFFADDVMKRLSPENTLKKILIKATDDLNRAKVNSEWVDNILAGDISQKLEFSLKDIEVEGTPMDPTVLSALQVTTFKNTLLQDRTNNKIQTSMGAYMAGNPVVSLNLDLEESNIYVGIPELFQYFVQINPKAISEDINNSVIASLMGSNIDLYMSDEEIYDVYKKIFVKKEKNLTEEATNKAANLIMNAAEYNYLGNEDFDTYDGIKKADSYSILLKKEAVNEYIKSIDVSNINVTEDILLKVAVYKKALAGIQASVKYEDTEKIDVLAKFSGKGNIFNMTDLTIEKEDVGRVALKSENMVEQGVEDTSIVKLNLESTNTSDNSKIMIDMTWDKDAPSIENFEMGIQAESMIDSQKNMVEMKIVGNVDLDQEKKSMLLNFNDVRIDIDNPIIDKMKLGFAFKYQLNELSEDDWAPKNTSIKNITELSEMDIGLMYLTAMANPILSQIAGSASPPIAGE